MIIQKSFTTLRFNVTVVLLTSGVMIFWGQPQALVYTSFFLITTLFAGALDYFYHNKTIYRTLLAILLILYVTFVGLRDFGIGTDTSVYIQSYYEEAVSIHSVKHFLTSDMSDLGFLFLSVIGKIWWNDAQSLLVMTEICFAITSFTAVYILNQKRQRIEWSTFIFLWNFCFLNMSMNAMRQYCAMAFILCVFVLLMNRQMVKAMFFFVIAFYFHSSSVIALPIFVIYILSLWGNSKKRNILTVLALLTTLFIVLNIWIYLPSFAEMGIIKDKYAERYGTQSKYDAANLFGVSFIVLYSLTLYGIYKSAKNGILSSGEAYMAYTIHGLFFVLRLTAFFVGYLARISHYYQYIDIFFIAIIFYDKRFPMWVKAGIVICIVYMWYQGYIWHPGGETYPYRSSILGIE